MNIASENGKKKKKFLGPILAHLGPQFCCGFYL